jgi:4-hydroxy-tetrahydrodipicolinate synthase
MTVPFRPEGVWTALVTPFDRNGKLDSAALKKLVEFQIAQGVTGLVPTGTTGESPTLTWEEHNRVVEETIAFAKGKVGTMAGSGSNCTDEAVDATRHAREAGASAALVVDCYYNKPSSLELRTEYYEQIAEWVSDIPIVPYVIPGRSGTALSAEDIAVLHLSRPKRFPAVKEATGDLERMRHEHALCGNSFAILSGDDDLTVTMMEDAKIQAAGVVSVMSNIIPGRLSQMVAALRAKDSAKAKAIFAKLDPLFKLVGCKVAGTRKLPDGKEVQVEDKFPNPVPIKTLMAGIGLPVGLCRKPLGKMPRAGVDRCRKVLSDLFASDPDALKPIADTFGIDIGKRLKDDGVWAELTRS